MNRASAGHDADHCSILSTSYGPAETSMSNPQVKNQEQVLGVAQTLKKKKC